MLVSFFHAVSQGNLKTTIEPDDELQERELLTIDRDTIGDWFSYLIESARSGGADQESNDLAEAQVFWKLPSEHDQEFEKQDQDLGHCRLYLRVAEGLPSKVALVRRSGMLVTTDQKGLKQFHGLDEFAALCVFEDPEGNELLRKMENPRHDQFEPEHLPDEEMEVGRKAIRRVTVWIRKCISKHAKPPESAATAALREVAELLPDPYAEDDLGGGAAGDGAERSFGGRIEKPTPRPIRRPPPWRGLALEPDEVDASADGAGQEDGEQGGGAEGSNLGGAGDGHGSGEGDVQGGTGSRGGGETARPLRVHGVRILPLDDRHELEISFTSAESGLVQVQVDEAGDASAIPHGDLMAFDERGDRIDLRSVEIHARRRFRVRIRSTEPIHDRAWRVGLRFAAGRERSEG